MKRLPALYSFRRQMEDGGAEKVELSEFNALERKRKPLVTGLDVLTPTWYMAMLSEIR